MPFCPKTHFFFLLHYKKIKNIIIDREKKWASGQNRKIHDLFKAFTCKNPT